MFIFYLWCYCHIFIFITISKSSWLFFDCKKIWEHIQLASDENIHRMSCYKQIVPSVENDKWVYLIYLSFQLITLVHILLVRPYLIKTYVPRLVWQMRSIIIYFNCKVIVVLLSYEDLLHIPFYPLHCFQRMALYALHLMLYAPVHAHIA